MARKRDVKTHRDRRRIVFHVVTKASGRRWLIGCLLFALVAIGAWRMNGLSLRQAQPETAGPALSLAAEARAEEDVLPALSGIVVTVSPEPAASPEVSRVHPFDLLRLERERNRSREAEAWQRIVADGTRRQEERAAAAERLEQLWTDTQRESEVEHLLEAQGYRVAVTATTDRVHAVVDALLDAAEAARIGELIVRITGAKREAVTIVDSFSSGG